MCNKIKINHNYNCVRNYCWLQNIDIILVGKAFSVIIITIILRIIIMSLHSNVIITLLLSCI
jgi:hypothetical protein